MILSLNLNKIYQKSITKIPTLMFCNISFSWKSPSHHKPPKCNREREGEKRDLGYEIKKH